MALHAISFSIISFTCHFVSQKTIFTGFECQILAWYQIFGWNNVVFMWSLCLRFFKYWDSLSVILNCVDGVESVVVPQSCPTVPLSDFRWLRGKRQSSRVVRENHCSVRIADHWHCRWSHPKMPLERRESKSRLRAAWCDHGNVTRMTLWDRWPRQTSNDYFSRSAVVLKWIRATHSWWLWQVLGSGFRKLYSAGVTSQLRTAIGTNGWQRDQHRLTSRCLVWQIALWSIITIAIVVNAITHLPLRFEHFFGKLR
jgi:hypothetical protein